MGLCGELGGNYWTCKKHLSHGTELSKEEMAYELGDIVWYLDETALAIGKLLESNLIMNIDKLKKDIQIGLSKNVVIY